MIHLFSGDFQDGFEEADTRLADGELRCVNADGQSARARRNVVASEGALAAFVQAATGIKRERMRWDDRAAGEESVKIESEWHEHSLLVNSFEKQISGRQEHSHDATFLATGATS
jgi:hypothetical protein